MSIGAQQDEKIAALTRERDVLAANEKYVQELERDHVRWVGKNQPCQECNGPHILDTSLPSETWNKIAEPHEYLCALCIDKRLVKAGLVSNQAEFYFVGEALGSKLYDESHGDIAKLTRDLAQAREALSAIWDYKHNLPEWWVEKYGGVAHAQD
jgi:hypothetical protein